MNGFKVTTHHLCPPVRGGDPLWSTELPVTLTEARLDTSRKECGRGIGFCRELPEALRIAGLWPTGRPSRAFAVEAAGRAVERGDKCRTDSLRVGRECTTEEIGLAVRAMSEPFGGHAEAMAAEQMAWRAALARPGRDPEAVERRLTAVLAQRGLDWQLERLPNAGAVWEARAAWAQRAAWEARAAWAQRAAWDAGAARAPRDARAPWAAWEVWEAWAAWEAWGALTVHYAALRGWVDADPGLLSPGMRDAYLNGLEIAVPTGVDTLGWAMAEGETQR